VLIGRRRAVPRLLGASIRGRAARAARSCSEGDAMTFPRAWPPCRRSRPTRECARADAPAGCENQAVSLGGRRPRMYRDSECRVISNNRPRTEVGLRRLRGLESPGVPGVRRRGPRTAHASTVASPQSSFASAASAKKCSSSTLRSSRPRPAAGSTRSFARAGASENRTDGLARTWSFSTVAAEILRLFPDCPPGTWAGGRRSPCIPGGKEAGASV